MELSEQTHPLATRITHWTNAFVVAMMLWSGLAMLVADRYYAAAVHLLPPWFWDALQMTGHRVQGRAWHLGFAVVMIANALFYGAASLRSGALRRIVPAFPRGVYHVPQRIAYSGVMMMGAVMVLTGGALWFKRQVPWLLTLFGGERIALTVHVVLACALVAFILVHVLQVIRAGLPTLRRMLGGEENSRRALGWIAASTVALGAGFTAVRDTSGPAGIPSFLHWTVAREHDHRAHRRTRDEQGSRDDARAVFGNDERRH